MKYKTGDKVCLAINSDIVGIVISVHPIASNSARYQVFHDATNIATYFEEQLLPIIEEKQTEMTSLMDFFGMYGLKKLKTNSTSTMFALNAGKIKFIPFQFRPLTRILNAEYPRILIADEVGVGKTIETGIILKEFEKRDSVKSAIIICPKDLTSKWRREMKYKFDEAFEVLSSDRLSYCLDELEMEGIWPNECRKCIIGLEMLRREENIERINAIEDLATFDMLIVDEAHHVIDPSSKSHQIVEYFCECCDIVVFLSATPLQLGSGDLFSLLNLLLPEEFIDETVFLAMAEPNQFINSAIKSVRNTSNQDWQLKAARELQKICVNDWASKTFSNNNLLSYWIDRLSKINISISDEERIACLRDLESLHTFSHVINRTKRKDIGEFTIREPITVAIEYCETEQTFYETAKKFKHFSLMRRYGERTANLIMSTIERQITSSLPAFVGLLDSFIERGLLSVSAVSDDWGYDFDSGEIELDDIDFENWAVHLKELSQYLPETDAKANQLLSIIDDTIHNTDAGKLLVFSFFKHTLRYLQKIVQKEGIRVAVITGDTSMEKRDELRLRFRMDKNKEDAIDVLLCSEVGCEGLDYEFCNRMVNYDIPWNPMKIEQRIGRIDRFGQKSPKIQIYNFITSGTVEEKIFYRCYDRLGIFNSTIGDLEGVLGELATDLGKVVFDIQLNSVQKKKRTQQLLDNAIRLAEEQRKLERDSKELFLMDIEINDINVANERDSQIQWQKHIVRSFFRKEYPDSTFSDHSYSTARIRMFKSDKQKMLRQIFQFKKQRKIDRNNQQVVRLEQYLSSDSQIITLQFDSAEQETDKQMLYVSATHPFVTMALEKASTSPSVYTACKTSGDGILRPGKYLFACYDWNECGYRQNNDIRVLLFDLVSQQPVEIPLCSFEHLLLSSKEIGQIPVPDLAPIDNYIYQSQQSAKNRLLRINEDIIRKKLSTLDRYYTRQIKIIESSLRKAQNERIRLMYRSRIQKLKFAWQEKQNTLNDRMQADILVELFASGIIEVE